MGLCGYRGHQEACSIQRSRAHAVVVVAVLLLHDAHAEEVTVEARARREVADEEVDFAHGLRGRGHQRRHLPQIATRVLHGGDAVNAQMSRAAPAGTPCHRFGRFIVLAVCAAWNDALHLLQYA